MSRRFPRKLMWALALTATLTACSAPPKPRPMPATDDVGPKTPPPLTLDSLAEGAAVHGFVPISVYVDGSDRRIGARFVHQATKFTFDYLQIESAPQGYLWVGSYPTSDKGEPHTQEHLLLGKGDRGRKLG